MKTSKRTDSRLIDAVCYLGLQELAFTGHDESVDSHIRGNYVELLYLLAQQDERLNNHLQTSTVFFSNKKEITDTSYVAIIMDETTDIFNKSQLLTVGEVQERFLRFDNVSDDRTAPRLAKHVLHCIDEFSFGEDFSAQTYDGAAAIMAGEHNGLQKLIKGKLFLFIIMPTN
ncbi:hypothetical protein ILUMI_16220 [Ignelater luminosus]|uniref:DUF4371 domain-containing protein n=1 Tax=Ignelater luminosus TaxID=2038154 RepID=A0A8K0CSP3_IGNLU|nr:hypothetical protein ILUMI_16220 [Ignelater luminosus]